MKEGMKIHKLSEAEKVRVLRSLEEAGSMKMLDQLLRKNFAELATSQSEEVRAQYARWQEVARRGLEIEAKWGQGALLKLSDPVYVDLRARGLLNAERIRNAEAYAAAQSARELNSPSAL